MEQSNEERDLALSYVTQTRMSVFLTGKAGTGKTTFLRDLANHTSKRFVVLAPTGVAAVNAGGVTIHSFFQLPFCPYLPEVKELVTEYQLPEKKKYLRKSKIDIIRTLDLLVIDEISMVRADLLDAVDMMLRRYRRSSLPFGGVQLLMIGDIQQLPPVVGESEKKYLEQVYETPFFFASKALRRLQYITIELKKIYRQQDARFVELLNKIRDNRYDAATLSTINSRYIPDFEASDEEGYIRLTTHNVQAESHNRKRLEALDGKERSYEAEVSGDFPETSMPTEQTLQLKEGAQVMFVRNNVLNGYYNGKIGWISTLEANEIVVRCEDGEELHVGREVWENIQYEINKKDNQIAPIVKGTFRQFPLKIAWAITIHKSQGLTFDKVVIDAGKAFAYGQVYVALSRCRTLEGIVLESRISNNVAFTNSDVERFNQGIPELEQVASGLEQCKETYYYEIMRELFDFEALERAVDELNRFFQNKLPGFLSGNSPVLSGLVLDRIPELMRVNERFMNQLAQLSVRKNDAKVSQLLAERIRKASVYYCSQWEEIDGIISPIVNIEIDNKENNAALKDLVASYKEAFRVKISVWNEVIKHGFTVDGYLKAKVDGLLKTPKESAASKVSGENDVENKDLLSALSNWRKMVAKEKHIPAYCVFNQVVLYTIAALEPTTLEQLKLVKGFGKKRIEQYGNEIIDIVKDYAAPWRN